MNKMKEVAQLLGVELDEEFEIVGKESKYKITEDGLKIDSDSWYTASCVNLVLIIKGTLQIKKPIIDKQEKEYLENVVRPFDGMIFGVTNDE